MIKLQRPAPPEELTEEVKRELLARFQANKKDAVWKQPYIIKNLLAMSNNKCVYCECKVDEESKYMEVDHFYPKSTHSLKVVEWTNLLPSCKRCNGSAKMDHDPAKEPIIDPTVSDPRNYLSMKAYRLQGEDKDGIGQKTIDVIKLNDVDRLVIKRKKIGDELTQQMEDLYEEIQHRMSSLPCDGKFTAKVCRRVTAFLKLATPESEYAATKATILLNDRHFTEIKRIMQEKGIWFEEHENLFKKAEQIKLQLK